MGVTQISFRIDSDVKTKFDFWCLENKTSKTNEIIRHITNLVIDDLSN